MSTSISLGLREYLIWKIKFLAIKAQDLAGNSAAGGAWMASSWSEEEEEEPPAWRPVPGLRGLTQRPGDPDSTRATDSRSGLGWGGLPLVSCCLSCCPIWEMGVITQGCWDRQADNSQEALWASWKQYARYAEAPACCEAVCPWRLEWAEFPWSWRDHGAVNRALLFLPPPGVISPPPSPTASENIPTATTCHHSQGRTVTTLSPTLGAPFPGCHTLPHPSLNRIPLLNLLPSRPTHFYSDGVWKNQSWPLQRPPCRLKGSMPSASTSSSHLILTSSLL